MASIFSAKAAQLNLNDMPLFVSTSVPPNIVVSMDDSGSMAWGFMPDAVGSDWREIYYRSANHNKIYYDPTVDYIAPSDSVGTQLANADYTDSIRGYYYDGSYQVRINLSTHFVGIYNHYYNDSTPDLLGAEESTYDCGTAEGEPCDPQPAYYYDFNNSLSGCTTTIANQPRDEDCYSKVVINTDSYSNEGSTNESGRTLAEEQTNFANWFQYYSIRGDAGKTALTRAFTPDSVSSSVRVGRQALNHNNSVASGGSSSQVSEFDAAERANFYDWIDSVRTSGGTPLRSAAVRAGNYYTDINAYRDIPSNSSSDAVSCRLNTHIMLTDGFYNGSFTDPSDFFHDEDTGNVLPDGTAYNPGMDNQHIYPNDNTDSSLADIMWHYWASDLASTLTDNLPAYYTEEIVSTPTDAQYWNPTNDPATWQHMVSYMVSFGLSGSVPTTEAVYQNLLDGTSYIANDGVTTQTGWPGIGNNSGVADDLYHAGINGHGGFFSATDPNELVDAFKSITERIAARQSTASTVVANSGRISSGNLVYLASFDTEKWIGQLQAFEVSDGSGFDPDDPAPATCNDQAFGSLCSEVWDAARENTSVTLPHATRKIYTFDDTLASGNPIGGIDFNWSSLNPTQAALLNDGDGQGEARVNYLRGDAINESENGGSFRSRRGLTTDGDDTRVGPIVHSAPVYVGNGVDANGFREYAFSDTLESKSYSAFLTSIASRDPMIYAGGNDGMLHAFNAERTGGEEVFAYVPNEILKDIHELTESTFSAGAYVDGPISTLDVFYSGDWHSVLVGALRTGGKGIYALDITDPTAAAADIALWEFTDANDVDMGYSFGKAQLVKLNNGEWAAIVANGYNSTNEKAVLYVLDIEDGSVIKKFEVDTSGDNGLSGPVAISVDRDFMIDYIYAGDLKGNIWKFDLTSTVVGDWEYAKLFKADSGQAITGSVTVGNHPENKTGRLVYFGTGKYLEQSDLTSTNTDSFYAVLDDDTCTGGSACITSSALVSQTVDGASIDGRTITDNAVDWNSDKGWSLDLSSLSGISERVVGRPALSGSLVIFNTIIPESGRCNSGGETFTFVLDRNNGGAFDSPTLDYNADGRVNGDDKKGDKVVVAMQPKPPSTSSKDPAPDLVILVSGDGLNKCINVAGQCTDLGGGTRSGRVRWRQLK
ncbi:MAG: hypothetical protein HOH29_00605 [Cellvibrionales bacterium]|nr:hypothetical protein [Cellvibrionales bacterium]